MEKQKLKKSVTESPDFHDYVAADAVYQLCELFHKTMELRDYQTFDDRDDKEENIYYAPVNIGMEIVRQIFKICEEFFNNEREADDDGNN